MTLRQKLTRETIQKDEYYSASRLGMDKIFPWMKSPMTILKRIKTEEGRKLFKPIVSTIGIATYYKIKGETVLEILDLADRGLLNIQWKKKSKK
jgi:hypothetical protein